jgi:hypothetical protein
MVLPFAGFFKNVNPPQTTKVCCHLPASSSYSLLSSNSDQHISAITAIKMLKLTSNRHLSKHDSFIITLKRACLSTAIGCQLANLMHCIVKSET